MYETKVGSTVTLRGKHGGIVEIDFDWVEEKACCECKPEYIDGCLSWSCDYCDGGSAGLTKITEHVLDPDGRFPGSPDG